MSELYKINTSENEVKINFSNIPLWKATSRYILDDLSIDIKDSYFSDGKLNLIKFKEALIEDFEKNKDKIINFIENQDVEKLEKQNLLNDAGEIITDVFDKRKLALLFAKQQPFFYDRSKRFYLWDRSKYCYKDVDDTDLLVAISKQSQANTINSREKYEILEAFKQVGRSIHPEELSFKWVQFKSKLFNIETNEIKDATFEYFCKNPIPFKIGDSNKTPNIDKFLRSLVQSDTEKEHLKEIIICSFIRKNLLQIMVILIGTGRNGKSTFANLLRLILGDENCTSVDLDKMRTSRFEMVKLVDKLLADFGELDRNRLIRTNFLKSLVGEEPISAEQKGKPAFEFENVALPILSCNELPQTSDHSDGFYRRVVLLIFKNKFKVRRSPLLDIDEKEIENFCKYAIETLPKIYANYRLTYDLEIEEKRALYERLSNPISQFYDECIEEDIEAQTPVFEVKDALKLYCDKHNFAIQSDTELGRFMKEKGVERKKRTIKREGESKIWWCYVGVFLKKQHKLPDLPDLPTPFHSKTHIEKQVETTSPVGSVGSVLDKIPNEFSFTDFVSLLGGDPDANDILRNYLNQGLIVEIKPNRYKKVIK